jgi:peptide/nickel transport system permease protein
LGYKDRGFGAITTSTMTDDGAKEQPASEAPASAPVGEPTPAPDMPAAPPQPIAAAEPDAPVVADAPAPPPSSIVVAPIPSLETPAPAEPVAEPRPAPEPEPVPTPPTPQPAPAAPAPAPSPSSAGGVPPMLEFASWRLVELVVTVAVAAVLFALLLRADAPADAALLVERIGVTVPLLTLALLVAVIVGLPIGYAAARGRAWVDVPLRNLATIGASAAPIWMAALLVLLFAGTLKWLQPGGFVPWAQSPLGALSSLVLPALALGLPLAAELALRLRDALRLKQASPAIETAMLMGMERSAAIRSIALRHALADLCGRMILPLSLLVPASLVVENVFYLPGLGRMIFTALSARDFATLQLGLIAVVVLVSLCRFGLLMLQAVADPRIARRA